MLKFLKSNIKWIIIVAVATFAFIKCQNKSSDTPGEIVKIDGKKYEMVKHEIDTVYVDKVTTKYVKGSDIYHETIVEKEKEVKVPVYVSVDTNELLKKYYAKVLSKDKLVLDEDLGTIDIVDTISQNKIVGRKWEANVKQKTITETKVVKELPKNQVYLGLNGSIDKTNIVNSVGVGAILKSKKDKIYQLNIGLSNQSPSMNDSKVTPYVGGGVYWKLQLKK